MNILDFAIIAAYLIGLLALGAFFRKNQTKQDYYLGSRSLGWKPLSLSIMATQLSAVSFISAPAFVGLREGGGLIWLSYELALPIAMILLLTIILPALYRSGVVSIYDYLENRFGRSTRLLISLVFQISRSFATAIMIYTISIVLQSTLDIAFWQSILLIGVITLIYSLQGGMKAVVYGDAIQMVLIISGAALCLGFGLYHIGGWAAFTELVDPQRLQAIDASRLGFNGEGFGLVPMLFGGVILYASYYGCDQSEAQRSLSAKSPSDLRKMIVTASLLRFPITLLYCTAGLVIGTLALNTPEFLAKIPSDHPDWLMPVFIESYLPNGLIGLLVVAILAAAMSSLSSAINSLSAVSVEDISRSLNRKPDNNQYIRYARLASLIWGLITLILASLVDDIAPTVIEAINKIGSLFYGPVLATFMLAILTRRVSSIQINFGILCGVGLNIYFWLFQPAIFWFWWNLFGFICTGLVALSFTLLSATKPPASKSYAPNIENFLTKQTATLLFIWSLVLVLACSAISG